MGSSGSHAALGQLLPASLEEHLRRMPDAYGERYTIKQLNRHLQLLSELSPQAPVSVDVQSLGPQLFDATVVGFDRPGVLAAITSAVAIEGLNVVDLQLATYEDSADGKPTAFVDVARVSTVESGLSPKELADRLRKRLVSAFGELSKGDVESALSAASDSTRTNSVAGNRVWTPVARRNDDLAGVTLNEEYVLQKLLGSGGMSDVYLAEQMTMGRPVAVKLLKRQADAASDRDVQTRFFRETAVVAKFECPQIVAVLGSGVWQHASGARPWMALEYMPGGDLASLIRRQGPPPEDMSCHWFRQALEGLAYAHAQGVLHRDLKPHNLLLNYAGDLKLTDFGLLKQQFLPSEGRTIAGQIFGTPRYMSPEQALGESLDERSDIYSLGATFFEVFAGKAAFDHQNPTALLLKISSEDAPSLLDIHPHISRPMAVIIARMMARKRDERYQDVSVILADLESYVRRGLMGRSKGPLPGQSGVDRTLMANEFM